MKTLAKLIAEVIARKKGNKQFGLFYIGPDAKHDWFAMIGNPSAFVMLPEAGAEYEGGGHTPEAAVEALLKALENQP